MYRGERQSFRFVGRAGDTHVSHVFQFSKRIFFFFLIIFKTDIEMYITFYFYLYIDILTKNRENIFLQL